MNLWNSERGWPAEGRLGKGILTDCLVWFVALVTCSKYEWMKWSKGEQTIADYLFLFGSQAKGSFYI